MATYRSSNLLIKLLLKWNYVRPDEEWWWNGRDEGASGLHTCRDRPLLQLPPRHSTNTERPERE
jgi:hypothetical protein